MLALASETSEVVSFQPCGPGEPATPGNPGTPANPGGPGGPVGPAGQLQRDWENPLPLPRVPLVEP